MKRKYRLKQIFCICAMLPVIGGLSACSPESSAAIDNSSAEITAMTQEYDGNNIAEILMISYDGEQPALEKYGGKNPEIESFNNTVKFGIQQIYNEFLDSHSDESWIEIRSYPFTSDDYLQVVTTCVTYPNYGTDGDLYSYNFDKKNNCFLSIYDAMEKLNLNENMLSDTVKKEVQEQYLTGELSVGEVTPAGFLLLPGDSEVVTQFFLEVTLDNPDGEPWQSLFSYIPAWNELNQLNNVCLFDPADVDQMEPPLLCNNGEESISELSLSFDSVGLDILDSGYEYMLDDTVYFSIESLLPIEYSEQAVLDQIKSMEGEEEFRLINITPSEEHSNLLSYPAWLVVYESGENEDARHCTDIYIQTEASDFRVHTSVPLDAREDYHDEIGRRLGTVFWEN